MPEGLILARGTADPLADARRQQEIGSPFIDLLRDLPPIDRLEGFRPGGHSMYQRVMMAVLCGRTSIPAWTYWISCPPYAERVASSQWLRQ